VRRLLLALALVAGAVVAPGMAVPASASVVPGACATSKGVTVVVNFGTYGGTSTHCFAGASSSTNGVEALQGAGFTPVGTNNYGFAFICRINNIPPPSDEKCETTPPASAYWSYWYASNGGSWTYSSEGGQSHTVVVGGFEGWSFGNGSVRPTGSNPSRPPEPTFKIGPAASTTTHRTASTSHTSTTSPATKRSPTTTATSAGVTSAPTASSTSADSAAAALPSEPAGGGRSPWPFVVGGLAIAAVLAGAYVVVLRRRGSGV
jgi:hypothetical protein